MYEYCVKYSTPEVEIYLATILENIPVSFHPSCFRNRVERSWKYLLYACNHLPLHSIQVNSQQNNSCINTESVIIITFSTLKAKTNHIMYGCIIKCNKRLNSWAQLYKRCNSFSQTLSFSSNSIFVCIAISHSFSKYCLMILHQIYTLSV